MLGKQREHVIEKADAGVDGRRARTVEIELELDVSFGRLTLDRGGAGHGEQSSEQLTFD